MVSGESQQRELGKDTNWEGVRATTDRISRKKMQTQ